MGRLEVRREPTRSPAKRLLILGLVIAALSFGPIRSQPTWGAEGAIPFQPHPLPSSLARWQDPAESGDYFEEVEVPKVGYLVWSEFPVRVYIERPDGDRGLTWNQEVASAVEDWNAYLPLQIVENPAEADIEIWHRRPPLEPGNLRASSAETRYRVFLRDLEDGGRMLSHRFAIELSPTQTGKYVAAAALHELGHALGIWGHSPTETDVMYFAQVREPPPISARDINTLKRIYSQPTRLGWRIFDRE